MLLRSRQFPTRLSRVTAQRGYVPLAVCGAHLSGQPLNDQLADAGAFLIETTFTSSDYRLYALRGTVPPKPGLVRVEGGRRDRGGSMGRSGRPVRRLCRGCSFTARDRELYAGKRPDVKSFVCEPWAIEDAEDITYFSEAGEST